MLRTTDKATPGAAARPDHHPARAASETRSVTARDPARGRDPAGTRDHPRPPEGMPGLPRSLVLNASLEPLCIVGVHRAIALVLNGKAVVLETDGRTLHSEHLSLPVPHVLCLTRYVHVPYRRTVAPTRRSVLARDAHRCAYCAGPADTVDHVHPRSRGGQHVWTNVVAACSRCNHRKADRLLAEIGWHLLVTPTHPRGSAALLTAAVRPHPSWAAYLAA